MSPSKTSQKKETAGYSNESLTCLRRVAFFSKLSDKELSAFHDTAKLRLYEKGKILYVEEDTAEIFYAICSGWVKLFHTTNEGNELVVDMLTAGDLVGESAIFENDRYMCSALAPVRETGI